MPIPLDVSNHAPTKHAKRGAIIGHHQAPVGDILDSKSCTCTTPSTKSHLLSASIPRPVYAFAIRRYKVYNCSIWKTHVLMTKAQTLNDVTYF